MRKNTFINNHNGFSLLEITIVLIIISILLSAVIPVLSRSYLEKAANKTAMDMTSIEEASRAYFNANNHWPANVAVLQNSGFLPSGWNALNPFINYEPDLADFSYHISISNNLSSLTVYTNVPTDAQPIIQNLLPTPAVDPPGSGHNIYSSIGTSGSTLPTGTIVPWPANEINPPAGFLWCNGQIYNIASYPNLGNLLLGIYGGNGTTTFGVPDIMGRTIVGVDGMGGATVTNRIEATGLPNLVGSPNEVGSTFGEDKHQLTTGELPYFYLYEYINSDGSGWSTAPRYNVVGNYNTTGMGNFNTSLPTSSIGDNEPHNVIQPSIAMGYIIKY